MRKLKIILLSALVISISGCGISPYRPEARFMFTSFGGHYHSEMKNGNYHVQYQSGYPAFRNKEKVRDFALRRACELAIEKGYIGFEICAERGDSTGSVLEIQLTNSEQGNVINAKETLVSLRKKYK